MNGNIANATILNPAKRETWASARAGSRLKPSLEFVITLAFLGDLFVIFGALYLGFWVRFYSGWFGMAADGMALRTVPTFSDYLSLLSTGTVFLLGTFSYLRLYSQRRLMRYFRTAKVIVQGTFFWLVAYLAFNLIAKFDMSISRLFVLCSTATVILTMLAWRMLFFKLIHLEVFAMRLRQRVLFVGWGKEAEQLAKEICNDHSHPYEIVGCLPSPHGTLYRPPPSYVPVLGDYQQLPEMLQQRGTDIVILADLYLNAGEIIGLVNLCEREFAQFKVIPSYFQILASGLRLETISNVPVLGVSELPLDHFSNRVFKRIVDVIGATVGLLISAPLMAVFGAIVYFQSPGPVFYRQTRMGRDGQSFEIYKIRSMKLDAESAGAQWARENDPRRLPIGTFMRKWNIDEVPQFWNVLKGDMSLVGPRPERPELIEDFKYKISHYHARHSCMPGMTGWAQVNGWRGNTSLDERIRYDIWYVENWSLTLDARIMFLTLFKQKNAY